MLNTEQAMTSAIAKRLEVTARFDVDCGAVEVSVGDSQVLVTSEVEVGTTVYMRLPVRSSGAQGRRAPLVLVAHGDAVTRDFIGGPGRVGAVRAAGEKCPRGH